MLRLMCVTAHPDDEAGAFGGTLKLYHDRGIETYVLCLTPGQAAAHRGPGQSDQQLAAQRRKEFAAACHILEVTRGVVLDYADGQLHRLDLYSVVCDITRHLRQFRPHVLVTFGPDGAVTAHPDHSMASIYATLAYHWAGRTNRFQDQFKSGLEPHRTQKLYYGTADFSLAERQPVSLAPITAAIEIGPYLATRTAAFRAHLSQAALFPIFENTVRQRGTKELFHLAARTSPGVVEQETDLFAGVRDAD
ncbi:MAG: PIG-L family deacetylase [Acidobacteria bacterium]|nr:PIG-L family deacetylase [Acidobacteriota bacterium]MBV9482480.1 PIG-L family deacetylase [Acidobacteriota bacterium]